MTNEQQRIAHLERLADDAGKTLAFLQSRVDTLTAERDQLIQKNSALVAENAGLKSNLMFWDAEDPETPYEHPDEIAMECEMDYGAEFTVQVAAKMPNRVYRVISALEYSTEVEMVEGDEIETPATDAAIAALRAEGVEMFAEHLSGMGIMASETSVKEFARQLRESKGEVSNG